MINRACTLKAIAYRGGYETSDVDSWNYTIEVEVASINATNFPDDNFRNYLLSLYYGKDGRLTEGEIKKIKSLRIVDKGISSLQGIEYFTALTWLYCNNNQLTVLDVSKNTALTKLYCSNNQLTVLDVSKNTALTELYCYNNQLT
ncbi:MAG: leucine-rich repeat domain-containing protein, partial [Prevotella sp.]|nr:leucine-rich repeat domain-containing protein [Prevotella sp.]